MTIAVLSPVPGLGSPGIASIEVLAEMPNVKFLVGLILYSSNFIPFHIGCIFSDFIVASPKFIPFALGGQITTFLPRYLGSDENFLSGLDYNSSMNIVGRFATKFVLFHYGCIFSNSICGILHASSSSDCHSFMHDVLYIYIYSTPWFITAL